MGAKGDTLKKFEDYENYENSCAVLFGDWGGEVYASIPLKLIPEKTPKDVHELAIRLEQVCWSCNITADDPSGGAMANYRPHEPGKGISGGMGGGFMGDGLWKSERMPDKAHEFIDEFVA